MHWTKASDSSTTSGTTSKTEDRRWVQLLGVGGMKIVQHCSLVFISAMLGAYQQSMGMMLSTSD